MVRRFLVIIIAWLSLLGIAAATETTRDSISATESGIQGLITQYAQKLGVFQDPFAFVYDGKQAEELFQRMCRRAMPTVSGEHTNSVSITEESPLGLIRGRLQKFTLNTQYDPSLVHFILEDAAKLLIADREEPVPRVNLQSNLLALQFTKEYIAKYREPDLVVDRDGASADIVNREDDKSKIPPKTQQGDVHKQEQESPQYPDLAREYKPFTKDTSKDHSKSSAGSSDSGSRKQFRVAEVNFNTPYFGQRYLAEIVRGASHPFRELSIPGNFPAIGKFARTQHTLTIRTFGQAKVSLFIPPLYKPLQPSDPRATISRSESGGYELELKAGLAGLKSEIQISLVEDNGVKLSPPVRELYTREVGFAPNDWPEKLQSSIFRKYPVDQNRSSNSGARTLDIAQAISDHISTEYLYSVGAQPETDPTEALTAGSFQCDMAAYSMVGILRDFYKIPSRVVGGYRAKRFQNGKDGNSYLIIPGEAHAWVEVFLEETPGVGRWMPFDPTPIRKDRKDDDRSPEENREEEKDLYSTNSLKKPQATPQPAEGGSGQRESNPIDPNPVKPDQIETNPRGDLVPQQISRDELADQLEIGSLELNVRPNRNPLFDRAIRTALQSVLQPDQNNQDIHDRLNQLSSVIRGMNSSELLGIHQEATKIHASEHPDLKNWFDRLVGLTPKQDVNKTYQELFRIKRSIEIYSQLTDRDGKIPVPNSLLSLLTNLQIKLHSLAHTDSEDIALVQDLIQGLPSVARLLLKQEFDFTEVGANLPTRELARKLRAGEVNELRLLSHLTPLSDFVLNSSPRPESIEIKTWLKNSSHPRGRDLMPLQQFGDLSRVIWGQPGRGIEENIKNGTAYILAQRKRVRLPAGYGKEEAERITILLYDTSGSMSGDPARFQAGLISAFTARAVSDVSASGRQRHRVVLVPFDDKVGTPIRVTNAQEALAILTNSTLQLKNTGGGTDIQKALIQAMALIADAEKKSGEPLAAANIILMTDGQASIESDELFQARKAIDRQTPLQLMFIAINQTSKELMSFAMESQAMGAERGFYREFTSGAIREILNESDHLTLKKNQDTFYSDKTGKDLSKDFYDELYRALVLAQVWSDQITKANQYLPAQDYLESLERIKIIGRMNLERPLEGWLVQVRKLILHPFFQDKRVLGRVIDDLLSHFDQLSGVSLGDLSEYELEQMRHLLRYASGSE